MCSSFILQFWQKASMAVLIYIPTSSVQGSPDIPASTVFGLFGISHGDVFASHLYFLKQCIFISQPFLPELFHLLLRVFFRSLHILYVAHLSDIQFVNAFSFPVVSSLCCETFQFDNLIFIFTFAFCLLEQLIEKSLHFPNLKAFSFCFLHMALQFRPFF